MWLTIVMGLAAGAMMQPTPTQEPNALICDPNVAENSPQPRGDVVRQRVFQFENSKVRVWKTSLRAGEPLRLHHNPKPRILVPLADAEVTEIDDKGTKSLLIMKAGRSYWRQADPKGMTRSDIIESNADLDVMVIEIKK